MDMVDVCLDSTRPEASLTADLGVVTVCSLCLADSTKLVNPSNF